MNLCFSYWHSLLSPKVHSPVNVFKKIVVVCDLVPTCIRPLFCFQIMDKDSSSNLNDVFLQYSEYMENEQSLREVRLSYLLSNVSSGPI